MVSSGEEEEISRDSSLAASYSVGSSEKGHGDPKEECSLGATGAGEGDFLLDCVAEQSRGPWSSPGGPILPLVMGTIRGHLYKNTDLAQCFEQV